MSRSSAHHATLGEVLAGEFAGVAHGSLAVAALLGGHEDDTVTSLGAVDSCGGGVLQDLDGFDHRRVEILDAADLQTVDDVEGSDVAAVGGVTADADVSSGTRGAVGDDVDTGSLALEGVGCIGGRLVLEVVGAHRSHGTGEVGLLLHTVTDHDRLLKEFGVLFEDEIDLGPASDGNGLRRITDAGHSDARLRRYIQGVRSVDVRNGSKSVDSNNHDGGSDDGFSVFVDYRSSQGPVLGQQSEAQEKH